MQLIKELIDILTSEKSSLTDSLLKTKVLLHKISHSELTEWVNNELNGYDDSSLVPQYRLIPAQVLINGGNLRYQLTNHPVPLSHLDPKIRERFEIARLHQPLAFFEQVALNPDGKLKSNIPMEFNRLLSEGFADGCQVYSAWAQLCNSAVIQILIQVRSRLLDFALKLDEQFGDEISDEEIKQKSSSVDTPRIFNNAIFGNNTTILIGDRNTQTVTNVSTAGDFTALAELLRQHRVSENDIRSLNQAINDDKDHPDLHEKKFGPKVKGWLNRMWSKAVDTSWNIELNVAGSLLANALQHYYGWILSV